jgi:hypothetical protein
MKKITLVLDVAGFIAVGGAANVGAQSPNPYARGSVQGSSPVSNVPETAFFVGLGGSYNSVDFRNQNIFAQGISILRAAIGCGALNFHTAIWGQPLRTRVSSFLRLDHLQAPIPILLQEMSSSGLTRPASTIRWL